MPRKPHQDQPSTITKRVAAPGRTPDHRAAVVSWTALALLVVGRGLASAASGSWAWGLSTLKFVSPFAASFWGLAALALMPPLARRATPVLNRLGDQWTAPARRSAAGLAGLALAAGALVWWLGDRGYFVGDFALRLGIIRKGVPYARMFPQALPLDVLLHEWLIEALATRTGIDPLGLERALGVARAASLALLGAAFARALGKQNAIAAAVTIAVTATGALGLCTGYAKGLADLALLVMAAGVLGVRVVRGRGGLGALSLVTAAAILLHRSGLALIVPWSFAVGSACRQGSLRLPRPPTWAALAMPLLAALAVLSRLIGLLTRFDRAHLFPAGGGLAGAMVAAVEPHHLCDVANVVVWSAPLALAGLAVALARPRMGRAPQTTFLLALMAPWIIELLFVHPRQGMVRDWDVFVPAAVAIALAAAALIGDVLAASPDWRWLAVPVALGALAPTVSILTRAHDVGYSLAFASAAIEGPPLRSASERASLHQYRGIVLDRDHQYPEGAEEFRLAAELAPSPASLTLWLDAALVAHDWPMARDALAALAERAPTPRRFLELSHLEAALGRGDAARDAARNALALAPRDPWCQAWADTLGLPRADRARPSEPTGP